MRFVWVEGKKRPMHRLVMEAELGRPLRSDEIVRHRDGDLLNNDPSNLLLLSREEHFKLSMGSEVKEPWSEQEKDDAVRLYCKGMTIDEVAVAISRSYSSTRRLLAWWGVLRTPRATRRLRASMLAIPQSGITAGSRSSWKNQAS
jgi:HNH endonuclease